MAGISLRAYARRRGCTLSAVQKAIQAKRISTLPDGTIDPERADREWTRNTFAGQTLQEATPTPSRIPSLHESPAPSGDPIAAYLRARAVKTSFEARTAEIEYRERAGKLIEASRASEYAATFSAIVKDGLMAMPDRLAPMLAAVDDEKAIHRIFTTEVAALLGKLSKAITSAGL